MAIQTPTDSIPAAGEGLRDRKKRMTRQAILDEATALFEARGYDHVTVAEIADAANVSVKTLFTYFDSKEDLVFADESLLRDQLVSAVLGAARDEPLSHAVARVLHSLSREQGARGDHADFLGGYHGAVGDSPALQSRLCRMWTSYEDAVTAALRERNGRTAPSVARLQAIALVGVVRSVTSPEVHEHLANAKNPQRALAQWVDRAAQMTASVALPTTTRR
jgi:AcrR family transcriptional regulator